jgi:hypothetical protein
MAIAQSNSLLEMAKTHRVNIVTKRFLDSCPSPANPRLEEDLKFNLEHIPFRVSEEATRAFLVGPILREVWKPYCDALTLWSHPKLEGLEVRYGRPDFCFTRPSPLGMVQDPPYVLMVDSTNQDDFDKAWAHCLGAMLAAQKQNEPTKIPILGIVSNGTNWNLWKLEGDIFTQEMRNYSVMELPVLLGALHTLFEMAKQNAWQGDAA